MRRRRPPYAECRSPHSVGARRTACRTPTPPERGGVVDERTLAPFGRSVALKAGKYDHELRSLRAAAAAMRLVGAGNPPLHRIRVGLEFALLGHSETDGMIEQHAALARVFAEQLGLSGAVQEAGGAAYEQWDGRGWPGLRKGDGIPIAARLAQFAEFIEVAHRVGGVEAATALARKRGGSQFDPAISVILCDDAAVILKAPVLHS